MKHDRQQIVDRIREIQPRVSDLAGHLQAAVDYLDDDPQSSLTKSRIVLEKMLQGLYRRTMGKEPARSLISEMLADKTFAGKIERRMLARINAVRDMSNLGPHGESVDVADAFRVMEDLLDLLEWYIVTHDHVVLNHDGLEARQSVDMLTKLKSRYPNHLRPELIAVRFVQSERRCYLETTRIDSAGEELRDEITSRRDLAFVMSSSDREGRLFSPDSTVTQNAQRFVSDLDEFSIINCTDLFTKEAEEEILRAEADRRGERICEECGRFYSTQELYEHHSVYFDGPENYGSGSSKYCLECWLGVGPNDFPDAEESDQTNGHREKRGLWTVVKKGDAEQS
jgi:hypothetical protein